MAGGLYVWFMGAVCLGATLFVVGMALIFMLFHHMEKKETGAKHGFLEMPDELRAPPANSPPREPPPPA